MTARPERHAAHGAVPEFRTTKHHVHSTLSHRLYRLPAPVSAVPHIRGSLPGIRFRGHAGGSNAGHRPGLFLFFRSPATSPSHLLHSLPHFMDRLAAPVGAMVVDRKTQRRRRMHGHLFVQWLCSPAPGHGCRGNLVACSLCRPPFFLFLRAGDIQALVAEFHVSLDFRSRARDLRVGAMSMAKKPPGFTRRLTSFH